MLLISFVGNLSYNTSVDDVVQHFMKRGVPVKQVRLLTQKGSDKSRGCCFLEFDCVKHQQVSSSDTILDMSIPNVCCSPSSFSRYPSVISFKIPDQFGQKCCSSSYMTTLV